MIGHLVYNYEHFADLEVQKRIARELYAPAFGGVHQVVCYNGSASYKATSEDKLFVLKNRGHYQGAVDLINRGLKYFTESRINGLRYVVVTAADTWMINVKYLQGLIIQMSKQNKVLATSSWGRAKATEKPKGFATDFFVIDIAWNRQSKLFPLDYEKFVKKFGDVLALQYTIPTVESALQYKFHKYFMDNFRDNEIWRQRDTAFMRVTDREPVHDSTGKRQGNWPKLGLYTNPLPDATKSKLIKTIL